MAASTEITFPNLNSRKVLSTTCLCLLTVFLISQIGAAFTFVIALVISVALLWYFWTVTWFRPFESRVFTTRKRVASAGSQGFFQPRQSLETDQGIPAAEDWKQNSRNEQSVDWTGNLTRKPLHARRTNPSVDSGFMNGGGNSLNLSRSNNIFSPMSNHRYREKSFISSPGRGRSNNGNGLQQSFGNNLTLAALAGSTPKSLLSPRENMSFSSSFLYSPGSKLASPNSSMCSTNHRHYPTHQPEYSGLGQLPVVKWNESSTNSPVWKRRTSMQSPVMVKIAPPDMVRSESPLVQSMMEDKRKLSSEDNKANPCAKESVIAAIRECRKRGVDDDADTSSRASTPWEQNNKRRRVDGFSRSSTPSMASSSDYDTAPPSGRTSTTGSVSSDLPGPKGIQSRTPRNAIKSSFSSVKRVQKRKLPETVDEDDEEESITFSPPKKPMLGLDTTSEELQAEEDNSDETSKTSNKENRAETPKTTPAKKKAKKQDDVDGGKDSDSSEKSEMRTPRKRSLRQLLARQKTPLRGTALYARAANMMNSPGEYTAADLQEDRHMARQRVSYIREALQEPEPPPATTTGPAATASTSTSSASLSLLSKPLQTATPNTTAVSAAAPSGLLAALSKATSPSSGTTASSIATSKPTLNFTTAPSSAAGPSLGLGLGTSLTTTPSASVPPTSSVGSASFFKGLSATNKPAAAPVTSASTTSSGIMGLGNQTQQPSQPPPSYNATLTMSPPNKTAPQPSSTVASALSSASFAPPKTTPTSSVGLLTQQIKAQDSGSAPNLTAPFQTSKPQAPKATTASSFTPIFGASKPSSTLSSNNTSATPASSIFSAPASTAPTSSSPSFKPLFPAPANTKTTSDQQAPGLSNIFGQSSAPTPSTASSSTFAPLFGTSTTSTSSSGGGFQMIPAAATATTTTNSNNQQNTSNMFQFGGASKPTATAATTNAANQPASNAFAFGAQNAQTNPSPFGAAPSTPVSQAQQTSIFGQSSTPAPSQQSSIFGGATAPAYGGQQSTASPFGGIASSSNTPTIQNPFGAKAPAQTTTNVFGQQQQQTASPFGASTQQQQTPNANPFGTGAQTQNAFGASTQAAPAPTSGVFTFGGNSNPAKPAASSGGGSGFNFGAAAQQGTPSSGFNFSKAAAPSASTGFNFGTAAQQPAAPSSGFQFGGAQQTPGQSAPAFGAQSNPGFNFSAGGSGFASAPASGRSTPVGNVGNFSVGASSGTSTAAQRRARLRQARGRSGRR